jgi:hypothetical protein
MLKQNQILMSSKGDNMDYIEFSAKIIDVVKEYLCIEDNKRDSGYISISKVELSISRECTVPIIKIECCKLPK